MVLLKNKQNQLFLQKCYLELCCTSTLCTWKNVFGDHFAKLKIKLQIGLQTLFLIMRCSCSCFRLPELHDASRILLAVISYSKSKKEENPIGITNSHPMCGEQRCLFVGIPFVTGESAVSADKTIAEIVFWLHQTIPLQILPRWKGKLVLWWKAPGDDSWIEPDVQGKSKRNCGNELWQKTKIPTRCLCWGMEACHKQIFTSSQIQTNVSCLGKIIYLFVQLAVGESWDVKYYKNF